MHPQILTLTADGRPHAWISWEEAVILKVKNLVQYDFGDDETSFFGGTSRMTGERSHIEVKSILALKGQFKYSRMIPPLTNQNLFMRDLGICGYCGRHFATTKLTRDHIVPVSRGGKDAWSNTISACKRCNNLKDDHLLEEIDLELLFIPYTPTREEHLIMQNRHVLADQMAFILDFLPDYSRMHKLAVMKFPQ
jgi:hypothetical protein